MNLIPFWLFVTQIIRRNKAERKIFVGAFHVSSWCLLLANQIREIPLDISLRKSLFYSTRVSNFWKFFGRNLEQILPQLKKKILIKKI